MLPNPNLVILSAFLHVDGDYRVKSPKLFSLCYENTMGSFKRLSSGKYSFMADFILHSSSLPFFP